MNNVDKTTKPDNIRFKRLITLLLIFIWSLGGLIMLNLTVLADGSHVALETASQKSQALPTGQTYFVYLPFVAHNQFLPAGCVPEPNNTFGTAVGHLQLNEEYCGYLGDANDYYTFTLNKTTAVKIELENQGSMFPLQPTWPPNNQIAVYNSNQNRLGYCCANAKFVLSMNRTLDPGNYYLLVYAYDINPTVSYTLKIED